MIQMPKSMRAVARSCQNCRMKEPMHPNGKSRRWRRRWIVAAFVVVCVVVIAFVIAVAQPPRVPRVIATFEGFTKTRTGPEVRFTLSNESRLMVNVEGVNIGGKPAECSLATIPAGKTGSVSAQIPHDQFIVGPRTDWVVANTRRVPLPTQIEFRLRRQDTRLEEAREMLDSVLQSIGISVPGLNPDSARNRFQIRSEVPEEEL